MFNFSLVATKSLEYSNRETFFQVSQVIEPIYRETVF